MGDRFLIQYGAASDRGLVRERNEDCVAAIALAEDWRLFVVADGLGGHRGGQWASQEVVSVLKRELEASALGIDPREALVAAFQAANQALWRQSQQDPSLQGAATTLVAALLGDGKLWWANVGDSRAYLVRGDACRQITEDHSLVGEYVRSGRLSAEQARRSPYRNIVTRTIGYQPEVEVDVGGPLLLEAGDVILLCSDGLYEPVSDDEMADTVRDKQPDEAARALIALANRRGGPDNVSVVLCSLSPAD